VQVMREEIRRAVLMSDDDLEQIEDVLTASLREAPP
jgi:hypothetical protein